MKSRSAARQWRAHWQALYAWLQACDHDVRLDPVGLLVQMDLIERRAEQARARRRRTNKEKQPTT